MLSSVATDMGGSSCPSPAGPAIADHRTDGLAAGSIAATLGVYGSASTWVFNVLRELSIAAHGEAHMHAFFANELDTVRADPRVPGRHLVWKLHQADADWLAFAAAARPRLVLTIRDPRDCVASMMLRFGTGFDPACAGVLRACHAVAAAARLPHLGLRYERRFFDDRCTVAALASHLGLSVAPATQARIFEAYRTERVRDFGRALDRLPPERIATVGDATRFDIVTHIHHRHIGDQRVGKWRDFGDAERALLADRFAPILAAFGYAG